MSLTFLSSCSYQNHVHRNAPEGWPLAIRELIEKGQAENRVLHQQLKELIEQQKNG